jgi:hypothetical protein
MIGTTWWQKSSQQLRDNFLWERSRYTLNESVLVENLGFTFNSKLMMLEEDLEIKSLHANFAFDEVAHLNMIRPFLFFDPAGGQESNPLLQEIGRCIELGDAAALNFMVQVVLEGFGIAHYSGLAAGCTDPELKTVLEDIVKDEAFHHGGGVLSLKHKEMTSEGIEFICDVMENVASFFANWAHPFFRSMHLVQGSITKEQMNQFLADTNANALASERIAALKKLVVTHAPEDLKSALLKIKSFEATPSHTQMVDAYGRSICNPEAG